MTSDDESSTFGVLSVPSDTEGVWDDGVATEDFEYESNAPFRMPAPDSGHNSHYVPAPSEIFETFQLPSRGPLPSNDLEFIIFAPAVAARSIYAILHQKAHALPGVNVRVVQFDGTSVRSLETDDEFDSTVSSLSYRVGVLYYSSLAMYNPVMEYHVFKEKYNSLPLVAISDRLLDPFCLNARRVITSSSSDRHLIRVTTLDGRKAKVPIPMHFLPSVSLSALVPLSNSDEEFSLASSNSSRQKAFALPVSVGLTFSVLSLLLCLLAMLRTGGPAAVVDVPVNTTPAPIDPFLGPSATSAALHTGAASVLTVSSNDVLAPAYSGLNLIVDGFVSSLDFMVNTLTYTIKQVTLATSQVLEALSDTSKRGYAAASEGTKVYSHKLQKATVQLYRRRRQISLERQERFRKSYADARVAVEHWLHGRGSTKVSAMGLWHRCLAKCKLYGGSFTPAASKPKFGWSFRK